MKPIKSASTPTLSAEEIRVVSAYRKMDARRRRENLALLESDAGEHPACAAPTLRIVGGSK